METSPRQSSISPAVFILTALATLLLLAHAAYYYPFLSDDALISLRYADRLLEGHGLTWTDGHPVEGYSNLLWILLVALLGLFRMDLILAARLLGVLGMALVVFTLARWRPGGRSGAPSWLPPLAGTVFFVASAPIAVWSIGGLEQPLLAALLALSLPLTFRVIEDESPELRTVLALSLFLGLLCLTRPDGPLFSVAAFVSIMLGRRLDHGRFPRLTHLAALASLPVLLYGGQLAFRLAYYGEWVPNTALVKVPLGVYRLREGAEFAAEGLGSLLPFSAFAVLYLLLSLSSPQRRSRSIPLLMIVALWSAYVVFLGGDAFPAYRQLVPVVVCLAFALVEMTDWALSAGRSAPGRLRAIWVGGLLILTGVPFVAHQFLHPFNRLAVEERWEWDGKVLALVLKKAFDEEQPLLAVTAAGCLPYWSELPSLDMMGLNDYYIPRHPPEDAGEGLIGHDLGDGDYVLRRRPDLIVFTVGNIWGEFRSGRELQAKPEFFDLYAPVRIRGTEPHEHRAVVWMLRDSPKVGIVREPDRVRVPGYLLLGRETDYAYLNAEEELVMPLHPGQSAQVTINAIPSSGWEFEIVGKHTEDLRLEPRASLNSLIVVVSARGDQTAKIEEIVLRRK